MTIMSNLVQRYNNSDIIKHCKEGDEPFVLKSGEKSKFYVDFRLLSSYPMLLKDTCIELNKSIKDFLNVNMNGGEKVGSKSSLKKSRSLPPSTNYYFNLGPNYSSSLQNTTSKINTHIVGVPTGGYSIAQTLSIQNNYSCLMLRSASNIKKHGRKRELEGVWEKGDRVILVDDVITSGTSVIETIDRLDTMGISVIKVVVLLCRDENAIKTVWQEKNIRVEYLFSMDDIKKEFTVDDLENTHIFTSIH